MPAMIVPFERLSPKHKNNTTYRGLEATDEQLYQILSENGIEALYDDWEETHWDSIKIDIRWEELKKRVGGDQKEENRWDLSGEEEGSDI